ncbi:MAG TPA: tetratricopeptide repeat protein [Xanthobacteraceae bacterium]
MRIEGGTICRSLFLLAMLGSSAIAQSKATCEKGQNPERILACSELLKQRPSSDKQGRIYRNRGQAYSWSRQYELAVKDYDAALDIDPNDPQVLWERGLALESLEQHRRAVADADRLISMGEARRFSAYQLRCRALAALRSFDEAIRSCSEQLRLSPLGIFYVDRGEVYLLTGQYGRAIEDFDAALKGDKNMAWAKLGRGKAMFAKQDYAAALEEFDQANDMMKAASGEAWPIALSKRGLANEALGRRSEAVADFQKALKGYPELDESKEGLRRLGASPPPFNERPWWRFW